MENIQKEASKANASLAKQSQSLVLPEEILELQREVGPFSINEGSRGYILNEIKLVFEKMYDGFTPEEKRLLEENAKNRIPESEYLPIETLKKVEAAKKNADFELGRIMKKVQLLAFYEEELSKGFKLMMEGWRQFKDWQLKEYEKQERSLRHYLAGKNLIVPADGTEFLNWFLFVKHKRSDPLDMVKTGTITKPMDFREFHEWKEPQVWEKAPHLLPIIEVEKPTFDKLFYSAEKMQEGLVFARKLGFINAEWNWILQAKEKPLAALWFIWKEKGLADTSKFSDGPAVQIIASRFGVKVNKNAGTKFSVVELRQTLQRYSME